MHAMRPLGPAASTTSFARIPAVSSVYQNCTQVKTGAQSPT